LPLDINVTSWFIFMTEAYVYTINQFAKLAGVSIRTLHYYDELGLLEPEKIGDNGYRYYGDRSMLKLQQILFYRELDLSLKEIAEIVANPGFDVVKALYSHRKALQGKVKRLERLIQTVDNTINQLKGNGTMNAKKLFVGFTDEEQEKYAREAEQLYDPEVVRASNRKWKAYSQAEQQHILEEGGRIITDLAKLMTKDASNPQVQAIVARWHDHMHYFWSPNDDQLLGLADLYNEDPRFKENYERVTPGLAGFMREAIKVYVKNRKK
jgi:DNA-binding transcriptional MerR regulator